MLTPTPKNTRSITDLREKALQTLKQANKQGLLYVFYRSKPRAVLVDINEFNSMQELIEDYLDFKEAKKLAKEPKGRGTKLADIKKQYV